MIELEKKIPLTEEEYTRLISLLGNNKQIYTQTNYYFDTDDLSMHQNNITCRIRLKDGKYTGTLKSHTLKTDKSIEIHVTVQNGIGENAFVDAGLKLQGSLTTERCILLRCPSCEVALDKNEYLGYTDYEIEIEYFSDKAQIVYDTFEALSNLIILQNLSPSFRTRIQNRISKSARFFERKKMKNLEKTDCPIENQIYNNCNPNPAHDSDPDEYLKYYFYEPCNQDSMCISCSHWKNQLCTVSGGACNHTPIK